jgi:acyl-CoA thioesterase YciA
MSDRVPAIRVLLLPKDTNAYGTIFGGVILSHIDLASAIEARKIAPHHYVTKAMHEVEFHEPVHLGDIVSFYTETVRVGRTSVTVRVTVEAECWGEVPDFAENLSGAERASRGLPRRSAHGAKAGETVKVTEAEVVLVAIGPDGRPVPVRPDAPRA